MLWHIDNPNTLRVLLSRFVALGLLQRIQRGLYILGPSEKIDSLRIATSMLHRYAYVSTETVLADAGMILQSIGVITIVSSVSRQWQTVGLSIRGRRLHERFLQHPAGIILQNGVYRAGVNRGIADMLYFDPWYAFDAPVVWKKVKAMQREIGYPLTPHRYAHAAS